MKKSALLFCACLSASLIVTAQDSTYLDIGNVRALIYADGILFQNKSQTRPAYEVPKGSNSHTIFTSSFGLNSKSVRNGIDYYASTYETYSINNRFQIGPVDIIQQTGDVSPQFNRLWKIDQSEIDNHIQNWNTANYVIPASILDWPGNGNANTAQNLAPYKDLDNDNIYEPQNGEYPIIKGDQAVFLMLNDYRPDYHILSIHPITNDTLLNYYDVALKVEMHVMLYAFNSSVDAISNTVFSNVKVFNRSTSVLDNHSDFHFSVFTDLDIGNSSDDYVGTDSTRSLYYGYNGDSFDESVAGNIGYGHNLAAQGVQFLNYDLDHSIYYKPDGGPNLTYHYYGYQKGFWKNGQPMYFGGDGFNSCVDTTRRTKMMFSGNPSLINDSTQWTENNACFGASPNSNAPGDRRMIGGPAVPKQLNIGNQLEINYAYVFAQDDDSSTHIGEPVAKLFLTADSVQNFFNQNIATGIQKNASAEVEFSLFPNPTNQMVNVNLNETNFEISIFDITGSEVGIYRNLKTIDVSSLSKGVYFFQIRTKNQIGTKKLIVTD